MPSFFNTLLSSLLVVGGVLALPKAAPADSESASTLPAVSESPPAYSILLAKEVAPTEVDGAYVAWAYGEAFCTQRQLVATLTKDLCSTNLTFENVPKLDDKYQVTDAVTELTGYFAGCSDDVSLGRSYSKFYWVELSGMYDGVGDKKKPDTSGSSTSTSKPTVPADPASYKCISDREIHTCSADTSGTTSLTVNVSCGKAAYTIKKDATTSSS